MPTETSNLSTGATPAEGAATSGAAVAPVKPSSAAVAPVAALPKEPAKDESARVDLAREELARLAEEFGLDATLYPTRQQLSAALEERRALIHHLDREAMLEIIRWGRRDARSVSITASSEQLAREIATIHSMRFGGLSRAALAVLAALRGAKPASDDDERVLIRKLKAQEGFVNKFQRKKRAFIGKLVADIVGENDSVPMRVADSPAPSNKSAPSPPPPRQASIKEEIEESGLFGGISNRIKRTADQYLNQKLDEIEVRIDRKLAQIDQHLSEWRDREIANRLKIIKITLWASVIVGIISLIYSWAKIYLGAVGR